MGERPYIELHNIKKTFGNVVANDEVNLQVYKGEIHAILGENGSGKSTLMNILSGIYSADSGSILINGKKVKIRSPKEAFKLGIGMIHQHFKLIDVMSAKENIIGGISGKLFIDKNKLSEEIRQLGEKYGLIVDPDKKVYQMSVSEKQTVEILKVLYRGVEMLILDEPTAVLTPQETKTLFQVLKNMKDKGCAIIIITHKLNEVMEVSDRVTVLRKGKSIATLSTADTNPKQLTELMVGYPMNLEIKRVEVDEKSKHTVVEIRNLTVMGENNRKILDNVSLDISSHEILGIAGVAGSGQKELCEAIAGLQPVSAGQILFKGQNLVGMSPREILKKGIKMSYVPEDRLGMGLVGGLSITDNVILKTYDNTDGLFIDRKAGQKKANSIIEKYNINTPGANQIVRRLSGGNIQKVLLGRELDLHPEFLITAYPVRGLDIGASYFIYDRLNEEKKKGVAILFVGEDLDVLLSICDRIAVMYSGCIMGVVDAATTTKEEVGLMMMGQMKGGDRVA